VITKLIHILCSQLACTTSSPPALVPAFLGIVFPSKFLWIWGITPPPAIVAFIKISSSSSPLMANYKCLGVILLTLKSFEAFPANSNTSAVKYSNMAALYTAAVAPTLFLADTLPLRNLWILPTGNCNPALIDLDYGAFFDFPVTLPPFPPLPPFPAGILIYCFLINSQPKVHQIKGVWIAFQLRSLLWK